MVSKYGGGFTPASVFLEATATSWTVIHTGRFDASASASNSGLSQSPAELYQHNVHTSVKIPMPLLLRGLSQFVFSECGQPAQGPTCGRPAHLIHTYMPIVVNMLFTNANAIEP
jgi:hypothetical protein